MGDPHQRRWLVFILAVCGVALLVEAVQVVRSNKSLLRTNTGKAVHIDSGTVMVVEADGHRGFPLPATLWADPAQKQACGEATRLGRDDYPGHSSSQRFDACVDSAVAQGAAWKVEPNTRVEVVDIRPAPDSVAWASWFRVRVPALDTTAWISGSNLDTWRY